jgi:hypothetical protein
MSSNINVELKRFVNCHTLHRRHDRLKVVLYAALRSCGYSPQLEPPHLIPGRLTVGHCGKQTLLRWFWFPPFLTCFTIALLYLPAFLQQLEAQV